MGRVPATKPSSGAKQPSNPETPDLAILNQPFEELIALPDPEAAEALQMRMLAWDAIDDLKELSFIDRGRIALAFEVRRLWTHFGYPSFEAWMCSGRGGSRATKYASLKAVTQLVNVSPETLAEIPRCNIHTLMSVSSAVQEIPEVLEAAKGTEEEFTAYLAENHPQQHIEARKRVRFMLGLSGSKVIEEACEMAVQDGLAGTRDEALVKCCEMALETMRTERMINSPEFRELMNEEAKPQRLM